MKGNKKEQRDFAKEIGLFEAKVVSINPTREELETLLGAEIEKDPEYVERKKLKDADGNETGREVDSVRLSIWLRDVKDESKLKNLTFYLEDRPRENKDKTKTQYINSVGTTTWISNEEGESSLPNWFTHFLDRNKQVIGNKSFRKAIVGEEEVANFIKNWTLFDTFDVETDISIDTKRLFRGNVKQLSELINSDMTQSIVAMATVRIKEKVVDEETGQKETEIYQGVHNKDFLPGYTMKFFRGATFDNNRIEQIRGKQKQANWEKFISSISDKEYGCKTPIFLGDLKPFNPEEHLVGSNAPLQTDDASY
jgi:hypothetical protein